MGNEQLSMFKESGRKPRKRIDFTVETEETTPKPVKKGRRKINPKTYAKFYREGNQLSTSIFQQETKCFPAQFGTRGREPLKGKMLNT